MLMAALNLRMLWSYVLLFGGVLRVNAGTGKFWHVTDFHYDPTYKTNGGSCLNRTDTSKLGIYGNYMCDSPWMLIEESVRAMKAIEPDPDFLVWTGDDTPHIDNSKLSEDIVVSIITNLTTLLNDTFTNIPVFAALGNHDYHPKNQMPPHTNYLYQAVWNRWQYWVNDEMANQTFNQGGYYTVRVSSGLRIVALNTVLYYKSNKVTSHLDDPANQFTWFDDVMTNSSLAGEKVYLVAHIPPGMFEKHRSWQWMPSKFNARLTQLIVKHAGSIAAILYGHHHTDTFRMFYNGNGDPVATGFIAPSVTPWKTTLPNGMGTLANNPGVRLISYDNETFAITEISQYFLNLTSANLADRPQWQLEYNATAVYDIPDVSPGSMQRVVESFLDSASDNFQQYIDHNSVSLARGEVCEGECKAAQYCSLTQVLPEKYHACFQEMVESKSTRMPTTPQPSASLSLNWSKFVGLTLTFALTVILS